MVRQTQMNGAAGDDGRGRKGLGSSVADLTHDVVSLTELQWHLLLHDCRSALRQGTWALLVALSGAVLVLCAVPVALLGAARLLSQTGVPLPWSFLIVAALAAAVGGLTAYLGARGLARTSNCFDSSRVELRDNLTWLKHAAKHARAADTSGMTNR